MRLPNGYGSCYKLSGKRRYPYIARITTGWTSEGRQILKTIGYFKTKQEGLLALSNYHQNPYDIDLQNITFEELWYKVELDLKKMVEINKMTNGNLESLTFAFNLHLEELHKRKIIDIKYRELQKIIDESKIKRTHEPLGYSAKGYMKTVCVKVYDYAIDYLEIPIQNIARKLKIGSKPQSTKHIPFTEEEIKTLFENKNNDLAKITLIWLYTGMRPNEIFKIKKENIHIKESYLITGSKTEAGINRIIPIHSKIKDIIKYFSIKENIFHIYEKNDYNKVKREFNKLMEKLGMNHTPYDCRHTFITKMKKANTNEYLLKRIVGHSIQDITEKTYTHRDIEELVNEVNKID